MRKFKKALAFALASAMIVSAVPASAAAKTNSAKGTKSTIYTYTVDKSKKGNPNNKRSWIKVTAKKGYTYKLVNKTKNIVTLTRTRVEAKKTGTAKINVNFYKNGKYVETKSVKITVKKAPMIGKVSLSKEIVNVGEAVTVSNAGKGTAYFYSSNKDVATVDKKSGAITAKAAGTTTISAINTITKARVYLTLTVVADAPVANQTGAKQITVTNGISMEGKTVTVKKGNQTVSLAKDGVTFTESGHKIIITTSGKLMDGEYTVTVGDKDLTVKAQTEKVGKITVDSDVAILGTKVENGKTVTDYHKAYAYYTVSNQFGEDITKNTTVTAQGSFVATGSAIDSNNKKVNFERKGSDDGFRLGDTVTVVVMYNENGQVVSSETKTLKISDKAVVDSIEVAGLYNIDGKELTEDTLKKDDFYILFTAKDQYGNDYTSITAGSNAESDVIATLAAGVTDVTLEDRANDTNYTIKTIKKDGKEYFGLKLYDRDSRDGRKNKAGQVLLTLIGSGSGKNVAYQFDVKDGVKVQAFTISTEGKVLAASDKAGTELSFTATDTYGNPITSYKELKALFDDNDIRASQGRLNLVEDYKTGNGKLMYTPASTTSGRGYTEVITGITETYGTVISQFTVQDKAYPKSITSSPKINALLVESANDLDYNYLTVTKGDLAVKDQYGRDFAKYGNGYSDADGNSYSIKLEEKTARESGTFTPISTTDITTDSTRIQLAANCEEGSKTYRAFIERTTAGGTTNKVDTYDFDFYAVKDTKIRSYEMKDVKDLYYQATANNHYAQEVVVYGKASGGVTVLMPHYYYGVTTTNNKINIADSTYICTGNTNADRKLPSSATGTAICVDNDQTLTGEGDILDKVSSVDVTVKATITSGAAIGTVLSDTIKLSKEKPTVQTDSASIIAGVSSTNFKASNSADVIKIRANTDVNVKDLLEAISVKDQYGKVTRGSSAGIVYLESSNVREYNNAAHSAKEDVKEQPKLTIYGIDETGATIKVTVKNNGTFDTIVNAEAGETFKLLITFANGTEAIVPINATNSLS